MRCYKCKKLSFSYSYKKKLECQFCGSVGYIPNLNKFRFVYRDILVIGITYFLFTSISALIQDFDEGFKFVIKLLSIICIYASVSVLDLTLIRSKAEEEYLNIYLLGFRRAFLLIALHVAWQLYT